MILNTRPAIYETVFAAQFSGLGHDIVTCPMLSVEPLDVSLPSADGFDAVIFTSQIGVSLFPAGDAWTDKQVFSVGEATAAAARAAGYHRVTCTGQDARDLLWTLKVAGFAQALYISAQDVAADLAAALPGRVTRLATYRTVQTPSLPAAVQARLARGESVYVPLFSRRSALAFADALQGLNAKTVTVIAISHAVAGLPRKPWGRTLIAPAATAPAMAATLRAALPIRALAA